jgi:predicted ArsR family transcriptional regulator
MAESHAEGGGYLFVENHCPICIAATACQGFCRRRDVFQDVLGRTCRSSGRNTSSAATAVRTGSN